MSDSPGNFRLVTRSDFDGLVCAILLQEMNLISDILLVHPGDMQNGVIDITENDITANLPYVERAHLVFDHHHSETIRIGSRGNHILDASAPSAAHLIYKYYGGAQVFSNIDPALLEAVDKADSANLGIEDVTRPSGWILLNFILDPRTGLGHFDEFKIAGYDLMIQLIESCRSKPVEKILKTPDIAERVNFYLAHQDQFIAQLNRCATAQGNVIILDLREEKTIWPGNRFYIYTLFPDCNISMHVLWGKERKNTVFAIGKSIFNKTANTNVGELCLAFGGGGHKATGTCQVENQHADKVLEALVARMKMDG